jgi:hypothetical protein
VRRQAFQHGEELASGGGGSLARRNGGVDEDHPADVRRAPGDEGQYGARPAVSHEDDILGDLDCLGGRPGEEARIARQRRRHQVRDDHLVAVGPQDIRHPAPRGGADGRAVYQEERHSAGMGYTGAPR